ncbi:hypothetical protein A3J61_01165 [Candidatus Nomurabacteria bacterium RIFCSPHIGHO2_02_FULL_38_15]|uniref:Uncharacterized protein n=1 Tax=Candidatus Nomurabacteria bacterium RIFCSPHIGHO2_02_FULL_38_15 TaxID=1801752 RepID=A0A1F6VSD2_9BACT|nr:MAG: hypothetical protein A3J61_01165 [Candidatus Nomurabacteria bacterium RIFCSPHIGHO2_02_FULL_38_15]
MEQNSNKTNKFVHIALIVGLVIVINLFLNYALSFIYKEPVYEKYFPQPQVVKNYDNQEDCINNGGQWNTDTNSYVPGKVSTAKDSPIFTGYCNAQYSANLNYEAERKSYELNVFITLMILGILMMIFGIVYSHAVLSPAFTWAGVLSYIVASMRYWSTASSGVRVIILGIALVALIWVALKRFKDR